MLKHDDKGRGKDKAEHEAKVYGYMRWPSIQSLYKELHENSLENAVDALWNNILQLYFRVGQNYAIVAQASLDRNSKKKAEFTVRYVHSGVRRKVVLVESKHVSDESSDAVWADAMVQLVGCMYQAREENPRPVKAMYGIITVGHYSRYYTLSPGADTLSNFSFRHVDYAGEPLHFMHDECFMHTLLEELVQLTCQ